MTAGKSGRVKCVVWDLDGTLWDGVLLEDADVTVKDEVAAIIRRLDERGVLHSISSKNDHELAMARLARAGLADFFLYPQINWNPKSDSLRRIAASLAIGIDALALVDDQDFELAEVAYELPQVLTVKAGDIAGAVERPEFQQRFVTSESRQRRHMYRASQARDQAEERYTGTSEQFLASLGMTLRISPAGPGDLQRAEELTVRTNQLNSTGRTFGYAELDALRGSPDHLVLLASLDDRFGSYGKIGLAVVRKGDRAWTLRLLLTSCRVVSRGVGTVLLNHVMRLAHDAGARLQAEFVHTGRNRMMYLTYAMAGFREVEPADQDAVAATDGATDGALLLESAAEHIQSPPSFLTIEVS